MSRANVITIEHIEIKKKNIDIIKKAFKIKDDAEAVRTAIDSIAGNLEIKSFFEKHKGTKIKKIYD